MASYIARRKFLATLLGGAAVAWPLAARAQQPGKLPTIGFLGSNATAWGPWTAAFVARLRELDWIEGRTVAIEYRWTEGRPERAAEFAAELVRLKPDVIVTNYSSAPRVKQARSVIPIVFVLGNDPLGVGLVASLARPGGNVTGLSVQQADIAGKRLELLREVVPGLRRLAIIANAGLADAALEIDELQTTARTLGLEVAIFEIRRAEDIAPAFEALKNQADALYVVVNALAAGGEPRDGRVQRPCGCGSSAGNSARLPNSSWFRNARRRASRRLNRRCSSAWRVAGLAGSSALTTRS